ncbi:hypothetical protein ACOI1H_14315 [Loktanella sp. DJP18]|uniref:hypothetical protein n=1 Tax=Loktanella sp. DJP18 TaxID=3409788 RepID=UPI003BB6818B
MARTVIGFGTAALAVALAAPLAAQEAQDGGMQLTFGISQNLGIGRNPNLDPGGSDISPVATTNLSLGYLTQTRNQRLAIDLQGGLQLDDAGAELAAPRLSLGYARTAADADLTISGAVQRTRVDSLRSLADFTTADGTVILPADLDTLTLDGNRTTAQIGAQVTWGKTDPAGYRLGASLASVTYDGQAATVEPDSQTLSLDGGVRLDITPVLRADLGLRYAIYDEDGSPRTDRVGGTLGLAFDRPVGALSASLSADETDDGTRFGLQLGRTFALPGTALTLGAGVSFAPGGGTDLTGQLSYRYALPTGQIDLSASRGYATATDGTERRLTTAQASYGQQLTPLSSLQIGFGYAETRDDTGDTARTASLSASQSFQLTPDWALSAGVRSELRDETGVARAHSETGFLSIGRTFTYRP